MANTFDYEDFTKTLLESMPEDRKVSLRKALDRNEALTSARTLEHGTLTTYKEGWYIELDGTRCGFKAFILDNDRFDTTGEIPFRTIRKPIDSKLHKLYDVPVHMSEGDYENI